MQTTLLPNGHHISVSKGKKAINEWALDHPHITSLLDAQKRLLSTRMNASVERRKRNSCGMSYGAYFHV